jgi:16S rRNA (cytidine1402-2'-O)-methyltransferase
MMLYLVSTPIGDPDDITLRALRILREANTVICEEPREGARLLRHHKIEKELVALNEHTERAGIPELIARLKHGDTLALISDHGTPMLADPGGRLVAHAIAEGIPVSAIPGASSLLAALVVSGLPLAHFRFVGFLPAKKEARRAALAQLRAERDTWVIFDAPYRLNAVLADLNRALEPARQVVVACNLTMPSERIVRGPMRQVFDHFQKNLFKGEYVIVVAGRENSGF